MLSLTFHDLAKRYNQRLVFSGLNGSISGGRALVITGRNGAGKSTLVRVLCGLVRQSAGTVTVSVEGKEMSPAESRSRIGVVAPEVSLYKELTALENLEFFSRVRGHAARRAELDGMLERVGLEGRGGDLVKEYSSGMNQRPSRSSAPEVASFEISRKPAINLLWAGVLLLVLGTAVAFQRRRMKRQSQGDHEGSRE